MRTIPRKFRYRMARSAWTDMANFFMFVGFMCELLFVPLVIREWSVFAVWRVLIALGVIGAGFMLRVIAWEKYPS